VPEKKKTTTTRKTTARKPAAGDVASVGRVALGRSRPSGTKPSRAKAGTGTRSLPSRDRGAPSTSPAAGVGAKGAPHRGRRRQKVGRVVSAKTPHTAIVQIERQRQHPLYKKVIRVRKRVPAHDANGDVKAGDIVRIQESRPFSATKRFQVIEVLSRAGEAMAAAPEVAAIERELEETEGVTELLAKPEREDAAASAEEADAADVSERTGDDR